MSSETSETDPLKGLSHDQIRKFFSVIDAHQMCPEMQTFVVDALVETIRSGVSTVTSTMLDKLVSNYGGIWNCFTYEKRVSNLEMYKKLGSVLNISFMGLKMFIFKRRD